MRRARDENLKTIIQKNVNLYSSIDVLYSVKLRLWVGRIVKYS